MGEKETVPEAHCEVPDYDREDLDVPPQDVISEEVENGFERDGNETNG